MHIRFYFAVTIGLLFLCPTGPAQNNTPPQRVPWATSRVTGSPEPPSPYVTEHVFKKLKFIEPIEMVPFPSGNRLVLAEHAGKIYSFPADAGVEKPDLFADMKQLNREIREVYSLAFHPRFAENRFVYIFYILAPELPNGTRIARFKVTDTDPPRVDLATEQTIITWKSGGHNGGQICFGNDGMLYISTGDGVGPDPPDPFNTGQDISDLLSSVLRIDVDRAPPGQSYTVPPDNPFLNTPGARPEVWAYGFRNPWRLSVDRKTGDLWTADVGWELWEMVYRVQRGGNYGWSIIEGSRQFIKPDGKRGPTPILPPTFEHPHSEAASITGGFVYRGKRFPDLIGGYVYGDYETGKIWELRHDGTRVTKHRELVDTPFKIVSFTEDREGELYIVDWAGIIHQFTPNPNAGKPSAFPQLLSETGLFASTAAQMPAPGVAAYSINAERWADHAAAERFAAFPGTSSLSIQSDGRWQFPKDAVLAKTYSLEMERGNPASARKIETQLLHFNGDAWNAYSFRWNDAQTDASLVPASGDQAAFRIKDASAPNGLRQQTWRFHSRAECLRCHNSWSGPPLAFNPAQLDRQHRYSPPGQVEWRPQLASLATMGLFNRAPEIPANAAKLANPRNHGAPLNDRARAWLHANCAHCHREHAGGAVLSFMNFDWPLEKLNLVGAKPMHGTFDLTGAEVIAARDPLRSVLFYRAAKLGKGHMPYLGSRVVDEQGLALLHEWIAQLPLTNHFPSEVVKERTTQREAIAKLETAEASSETHIPTLKKLLGTPSGGLKLLRALEEKRFAPEVREAVIAQGIAAPDRQVADLFERFVPEENRIQTLGPDIEPERLLALKGDVEHGRRLFRLEGGAQCQSCHRAEGQGRDFGPDLTQIGKKYSRAQILEHILEPSKFVEPAFAAYTIETKSGASHTGFLLRRSASEIVLKDAGLSEIHVAAGDIASLEVQRLSLMPEGLLQGLTAQDAVDLIDYLSSLR